MAAEKDNIYIDVDDEITGIIDKVKNSKSKVVALVLPKRASVFQSIVNMKLLKKAGDSSSKNLVLITSEAGLLPLAGAAGIHVAKTLTSKPEIPLAPVAITEADESLDTNVLPSDEADTPLDKNQTIEQLSSTSAPAAAADDLETVNLDNTAKEPTKDDDSKTPAKTKPKKDKKLKVPNFERFRKYLIIAGVVLILLIIGFIFANSSLAKATVSIGTNGANIPTSVNLNLSTTANNVNLGSGTLPATLATFPKTYSQQVTTTGQQNNGNKATGTATFTTQQCGNSVNPFDQPGTVPAGTGVSNNNQTYITQQDITWNNGNINHQSGCITYNSNGSTAIVAQNGGASYNVSGVPFTLSGSYNGFTVTGSGSASGGTDNIVQTVNQNDINSAKSKINTNNGSAENSLETQLKGQNLYPINATFSSGTPNVTTSANVGAVANSVTVTENVTYTMFGVTKSNLQQIVDNNIDGQIDTSKQAIINDGLSNAQFNVNSQTATAGQLTVSTQAEVGPDLNLPQIKQSIAGEKSGEIQSQIQQNPNVTSVKVSFSPFWATTAPKNVNKITINIEKPTSTKST